MIWPTSTARAVTLPPIAHGPDSLEDQILSVEVCKGGYYLAVITRKTLYIYRPKPLSAVAVYVRSQKSLERHGNNQSVHIRPDGAIISVTTVLGSVLLFHVAPSTSSIEVCQFTPAKTADSSTHGDGGGHLEPMPGPGESAGVRDISLSYAGAIHFEGGLLHLLALEEGLFAVTPNDSITIVRWPKNKDLVQASNGSGQLIDINTNTESSRIHKIRLQDIGWLERDDPIGHIVHSKAMSIFAFVTNSGRVYTAITVPDTPAQAHGAHGAQSTAGGQQGESAHGSGHTRQSSVSSTHHHQHRRTRSRSSTSAIVTLDGHLLHAPSGGHEDSEATTTAINARFSVVAVGCKRGSIYLYNIRDYSGTSVLIRTIYPPASSPGPILVMRWSPDGNALLVGYESGWALFSVYGMLTASTLLSNKEQKLKESWLGGISNASWSFTGDIVFMIPKSREKMWLLNMLKWSACGNYTQDNLQRPVLFTDTKMILYRGQEQRDFTTIDRDALLWLHVNIPPSYLADNWPIRYVSSSPDGRYIAVAGVRGLTHYSLYSGRWKLFAEEYMDREFTVRGGMLWYGHILIAAVDTEHSHEIRLYSREGDLDPARIMFSIEFPQAILKICAINDLLLVYRYDNVLSHFRIIQHHDQHNAISLELESEISFAGVIQSPARVRSLSSFLSGTTSRRVSASNTTLLMLVDGMLVLLKPVANVNSSVTYTKTVLHSHIEYCTLTTWDDGLETRNILWAFDGKDMLVWLWDVAKDRDATNYPPTVVPVEAYPLAVLLDKGIITGLESDAVLPREASFTYFKHFCSTQLFVPFVLESYLRQDRERKALRVARDYQSLSYFPHIMEMLLYRGVVDTDRSDENHAKLLTGAAHLVNQFPEMLDVVVGCTRKIELTYWKGLFDALGSQPEELFEKCIALGKLKTAAGYLIVIHSMDIVEKSDSNQYTSRLFKLAYDKGDWDLCRELARFVTAIDRKYYYC